jgi:hypothetical protein
MTKITYAICVCTEAQQLDSLLNFLVKVKEPEDDISILHDIGRTNDAVRHVLEKHKDNCVVLEKAFDGDFATHRNYQMEKCTGDYVFVIDADEMPQEALLKNIRQFEGEILAIPRINLFLGYTEEWLQKCNFRMTNTGWINWPDYQLRYFKNNGKIHWDGEFHEKLTGGQVQPLEANPLLALFHVKTVEQQDKNADFYDSIFPPVETKAT